MYYKYITEIVHIITIIIIIIIIIVLINGCFHNGPVMCPRSITMAQGVCIGPRQRRETIH